MRRGFNLLQLASRTVKVATNLNLFSGIKNTRVRNKIYLLPLQL